jgi:hypothetical protein
MPKKKPNLEERRKRQKALKNSLNSRVKEAHIKVGKAAIKRLKKRPKPKPTTEQNNAARELGSKAGIVTQIKGSRAAHRAKLRKQRQGNTPRTTPADQNAEEVQKSQETRPASGPPKKKPKPKKAGLQFPTGRKAGRKRLTKAQRDALMLKNTFETRRKLKKLETKGRRLRAKSGLGK